MAYSTITNVMTLKPTTLPIIALSNTSRLSLLCYREDEDPFLYQTLLSRCPLYPLFLSTLAGNLPQGS
jgi:hypothetical protein